MIFSDLAKEAEGAVAGAWFFTSAPVKAGKLELCLVNSRGGGFCRGIYCQPDGLQEVKDDLLEYE